MRDAIFQALELWALAVSTVKASGPTAKPLCATTHQTQDKARVAQARQYAMGADL